MANDLDGNELNGAAPGTEDHDRSTSGTRGALFEIHVKGHLSSQWSDWLEGLEMKLLDDGEMVLFGPIVDQAGLMGILNKLSRLNLTLLSVNEVRKNDHREEQ